MLYMATFTINIPQMLAYIPYMDSMGYGWLWSNKSPFFVDMPVGPGIAGFLSLAHGLLCEAARGLGVFGWPRSW